MSFTHQQYADLSGDSYKDYSPGTRRQNQPETVDVGGLKYNILEHYSNTKNGYQGTIYQRVDTGEIVVAHRGTEVDKGAKAIVQDAVYTDGSMALSRVNPQAEDAIELTRRALRYAERDSRLFSEKPQVTVTGHSLGGCLAQITAHHFNLHGETFNAYGAASLNRRIPEGGTTVLNHVMAGDTVSAASPHFGQVRVHAAPNEIKSLERAGYDNDRGIRGALDQRAPLAAIGLTAGSHSMHNFLNVDGDGRADRSILADPKARALAKEYDPMIDRFRDDVGAIRATLTVTARGPVGVIGDAVDILRGTQRPGEPGEREAAEKRHPPQTPNKTPNAPMPYDSPLFGPGGPFPELPGYVPKPADGPKAPLRPQAAADETMPGSAETRAAPQLAIERLSPKDRDNYEQAHSLAQRLGLSQDQAQNFGMAMAAQINEYGLMPRTDKLIAMQGRGDDGGDRVFASYHPHGDKEPIFNTSLDVNRAANLPADESFRRLEPTQQHLAQQQNQGLDEPARGQRMS